MLSNLQKIYIKNALIIIVYESISSIIMLTNLILGIFVSLIFLRITLVHIFENLKVEGYLSELKTVREYLYFLCKPSSIALLVFFGKYFTMSNGYYSGLVILYVISSIPISYILQKRILITIYNQGVNIDSSRLDELEKLGGYVEDK